MHERSLPMGYSRSEPHGLSPSRQCSSGEVLTSLYVHERCEVHPGMQDIPSIAGLYGHQGYPDGMERYSSFPPTHPGEHIININPQSSTHSQADSPD